MSASDYEASLDPTGQRAGLIVEPAAVPWDAELAATMTEHGVTSTFSYDDAGARNLIGVADTLGRSVSLTYDVYGNVASTTDGTASASFTFDVGNRLRTSRDGPGNATQLRYEHVTSNPIQDPVDSGFLPPGLTTFGKGAR